MASIIKVDSLQEKTSGNGIVLENSLKSSSGTEIMSAAGVLSGNVTFPSTIDNTTLGSNVTFPAGKIIRYYAKSATTGYTINTTSWMDTGLTINDIVVESGNKVFLNVHLTQRNATHFATRIQYTGTSSGTIGNSSWGLGINDYATVNWNVYSISMLDLTTLKADSFTSTGTFNFTLLSRSTSASGYVGLEDGGTNAGYAHLYFSIFIGN